MKKLYVSFLFIFYVLTGCTPDVIDTPLYAGKHLVIGVIGETPKIREENVSFKKINFSELRELDSFSEFDAVFIMKENLPEAAKQEYARIYKTVGIPFFFIQSKKSYLPFTNEELSYDEVPDLSSDTYATGYFRYDDNDQNWGYGLYNDIENSSNIKDVYTRIFTTIELVEADRK
jgi:hypothetical protein